MMILQWLLERVLAWLRVRKVAQQVDAAATMHNQEAAHAAHVAQSAAPASRAALARGVRDGTDF